MTVGSEFILKQSKLNFSLDSDLVVRSAIETGIAPTMTLQFAAEMHPLKEQYRFGYGLGISS